MPEHRRALTLLALPVPDDRGAVRACQLQPFGRPLRRKTGPAELALRRDLYRAARRAIASAAGALVLLGGMALTLLWALAARVTGSQTWADVAALGIGLPVVLLLWDRLWLHIEVRPRYRRTHRRIAMKHGRCPWCMYDIAHLPAQEDGCSICPECGGAWRRGGVPARGY